MDMVVSELLGLESSWTPFCRGNRVGGSGFKDPRSGKGAGIRIWVKNLCELKCGGIEIEREWEIEAMVIAEGV